MEVETGFEPVYTALQAVASPLGHSTVRVRPSGKAHGLRADNETRTRDPNLGKVVLYQLSYFRISGISECKYKRFFLFLKIFARKFTRQKSKKLSYNPSEPVFNAKSDYLTTESYSATTPQPPPNAL